MSGPPKTPSGKAEQGKLNLGQPDPGTAPQERLGRAERRRTAARKAGLERATGEQYYLRSLAAYEGGDLENALLDISEAIYYDPGYAAYYSTRGVYYIAQSKLREAEVDVAYALSLNRRDWLAHYGLGIVRLMAGDVVTALAEFELAVRYNSRRPEIWYYRAVAAHFAGDAVRALEYIDQAIGLFPDSDKRSRDAKQWRREIEEKLPPEVRAGKAEAASAAKKARTRKPQ